MGYMRHHAIVVSSWQSESVLAAREKASTIFRWVSPISPEATNGHAAFFVPPDGSKEGWQESDEGDGRREQFLDWLEEQYALGFYLDWAEVQFGDDEGESRVLRHSDDAQAYAARKEE